MKNSVRGLKISLNKSELDQKILNILYMVTTQIVESKLLHTFGIYSNYFNYCIYLFVLNSRHEFLPT